MVSIDLTGKTALVTGGSGELGRVICRRLAEAGANVVIHYGRSEEKALNLVEELTDMGTRCMAVQADVTQLHSVMAMGDTVKKEMGMPHIVVAAAVIQYQPWLPVLEQPIADYESQFKSCVLHNVHLAKAFVPAMQEAGWGRYIGINTECSFLGDAGSSAYASAKKGMHSLLCTLAKEVGPSGVTVNQIAPGWVISEAFRKNPTDDSEYAQKLPLKHRGTDGNIADAVLFFASELSAYITGVDLPVTGGHVIL